MGAYDVPLLDRIEANETDGQQVPSYFRNYLCVVVVPIHPSTWWGVVVGTERSGVQGRPQLSSKSKGSLGYARSCLKTPEKKEENTLACYLFPACLGPLL